MQNLQQLLEAIEEAENNSPHPCLFPGCVRSAIASHSLQKNRYLKAVANSRGEVCMIKSASFGKMLNKPDAPIYGITTVHINKATTFPGLCSEHDNNLFKPIEDSTPDLGDGYHQFLFAYRTALREQFARAKAVRMLRAFLAGNAKHGFIPAKGIARFQDEINDYFLSHQLIEAELDRFHRRMVSPKTFKAWGWESFILVQRGVAALVACESYFEIRDDKRKIAAPLIMCVLPTEDGLTVFFYFQRAHRRMIHGFLREVLGSDFRNNLSLVKLSTLIFCRSEIFCINLDHYRNFEQEKKDVMQELFTENMDVFEWNTRRRVNLWVHDV